MVHARVCVLTDIKFLGKQFAEANTNPAIFIIFICTSKIMM